MNAVAIVEPPKSKVTQFLDRVFAADRVTGMYLPAHIDADKFRANLYTAVTLKPELLRVEPSALYQEVCGAASLGLRFDPALGEAYLIVVSGKPMLRIGYRGHIKLAVQSGEIKQVYAHEVHATDAFDVSLGEEKRLTHRPNLDDEDPGAVRFYYAVAKFRTGETDFEVMGLKAIHAIRERSDAWRAYKKGTIKSTPWQTDEGEMAKKTVIRRLLKRLPKSPEIAAILNRDAELEDVEYREVAQPVHRLRAPAAPPPPAIDAPVTRTAKAPPLAEEEIESSAGSGQGEAEGAGEPDIDLAAVIDDFEDCAAAATSLDDLAECEHAIASVKGQLPPELLARYEQAGEQARARLTPKAEPKKPSAPPPPPADAAPTDTAPQPAADPETLVDRKHWAFKRGVSDFKNGTKTPLGDKLKNDPVALAQWRHGQDEAREAAEAAS